MEPDENVEYIYFGTTTYTFILTSANFKIKKMVA